MKNGDRSVAIVTAASRGIGAGCARALADRGYRLVLLSRSERVERLAAELDAAPLRGSVTEPEDLARLVETAMDRFGRIDGVVNNTGHAARGDLLGISDKAWHEGLDLLFLSAVRMARLVTPIFREQGGGALVNISTFAAYEPTPSFPVSSALRSALAAFTKMYADSHAAAGIRMNDVLPGFVGTFDVPDAIRERIPMKREATPGEVGALVAFLLSDEARYITGAHVPIDGGLSRSI